MELFICGQMTDVLFLTFYAVFYMDYVLLLATGQNLVVLTIIHYHRVAACSTQWVYSEY